MKSSIKQFAVVILCLGFVLTVVPAMNSAEHKAGKTSLVQIVKLPTLLVPSLLPFNGMLDSPVIAAPAKNSPKGSVRPTDDILIPKPGTGD